MHWWRRSPTSMVTGVTVNAQAVVAGGAVAGLGTVLVVLLRLRPRRPPPRPLRLRPDEGRYSAHTSDAASDTAKVARHHWPVNRARPGMRDRAQEWSR
jgi:hypothetical protein